MMIIAMIRMIVMMIVIYSVEYDNNHIGILLVIVNIGHDYSSYDNGIT